MTGPTRVTVDGRCLAGTSSTRGIGTYARHVLAGLAARPELALTVLTTAGAEIPDGAERRTIRRVGGRRTAVTEHELRLRRDAARVGGDVLFTPDLPPMRPVLPFVQTLHDVTPLVWPDPRFDHARRLWQRWAPRYRSAAGVVAVSHYAAEKGITLLGLDPARIRVAHHGVDERFRPGPSERPDPPELLYVSAWGPHKGLDEAIALTDLLADGGFPHRLRVAGYNDRWSAARVAESVAAARHPERIIVAGYLEDLPEAYRAADAFLATSRVEGFGLPALEAMACGTPVLGFATSGTDEVVGTAGALVPDGDVGALAAVARAVLGDAGRREELSGRGLERAARFTWTRSVDVHAEVLTTVLGQ